jgi:hypothetical protein
MAFKQATIKELRQRFNPAGEVSGLDVVIDIEDTNTQKITIPITVSKEDLQNIPGATFKDQIGNAIKHQVKEKYNGWARSQGFADKDSVSTTNATAIQTQPGFNTITQIDNI